MIRRLIVTATALALAGALAAPVSAAGRGVSPDILQNAGWFCFPANNFLHCVHDFGAIQEGEVVTSTVLAFDVSGAEFLGTELLIHEDRYNGQPCPQDQVGGESGSYVNLNPAGLDYFVCHHFDSLAT